LISKLIDSVNNIIEFKKKKEVMYTTYTQSVLAYDACKAGNIHNNQSSNSFLDLKEKINATDERQKLFTQKLEVIELLKY
jgi:type IV secretory pathway VirB4 component